MLYKIVILTVLGGEGTFFVMSWWREGSGLLVESQGNAGGCTQCPRTSQYATSEAEEGEFSYFRQMWVTVPPLGTPPSREVRETLKGAHILIIWKIETQSHCTWDFYFKYDLLYTKKLIKAMTLILKGTWGLLLNKPFLSWAIHAIDLRKTKVNKVFLSLILYERFLFSSLYTSAFS